MHQTYPVENQFAEQDNFEYESKYSAPAARHTLRFIIIHFDHGPQNVASLFCKATYRVKISISVTSNPSLTVAGLLYTDGYPNLINKDFLPQAWKESIRAIKSPQLGTASLKVSNIDIEGIVPFPIRIGNLCVHVWSGTVENPAVEVLLRASFIA